MSSVRRLAPRGAGVLGWAERIDSSTHQLQAKLPSLAGSVVGVQVLPDAIARGGLDGGKAELVA